MSKGTVSAGRLRISAGRLKGRQVRVPPGVRPTESRVREALFDILAPRVVGSRFLDLFAGSGAVGLEAVSRGAAACLQIDASRRAVNELRRLHKALDVPELRAEHLELPRQLARLVAHQTGAWDLVFADPPYAFGAYDRLLVAGGELGGADALWILEHDSRVELSAEVGDWVRSEVRTYGESALSFYRRDSSAAPRLNTNSSR